MLQNVFLYVCAIFVYCSSSIHVRFSAFIWLSILTAMSGSRWKWRWLIDLFISGSFTSQSLSSKLTSLCFVWSFLVHISTSLFISRSSAWVSVVKRFTCLLGTINRWCLVYGARAGITKKCFPICSICSGFSWQKGHMCVFSNFLTTVIYLIVSFYIKNRAGLILKNYLLIANWD